MRNILLLTLIIFSGCNQSSMNSAKTLNKERQFRSVDWGMSKADVKKNETADFVREDSSSLMYTNIEMFDNSFGLGYKFQNDKLVQAWYVTTFNKPNGIFKCYSQIKEQLKQKYGQPLKDSIHFTGIYTNEKDTNNYDLAFFTGNGKVVTTWMVSIPQIRIINLAILKSNNVVSLNCINTDSEFANHLNKQINKDNQQNF